MSDDGSGFEGDTLTAQGHIGRKLVEQTAIEAGGAMRIRSQPGRGTQIDLQIPRNHVVPAPAGSAPTAPASIGAGL